MKTADPRKMMKMLPNEVLSQGLDEARAEVEALRTELYMRSAPRLAEIMTALNQLTLAVEKGNPQTRGAARTALSNFFQTWERAKAASSGIIIEGQTSSEHPASKD